MAWKPVEHSFIKDAALRDTLHVSGLAVPCNIGPENIVRLKALYASLHHFGTDKGGMFYSLYSDDIEYRKKVHHGIFEILKPVYDRLFINYKTVINSFIVKTSGTGSDFTLHQDSTGLDEFRYSPLSLWIPLQDTDMNNGTLCVVPKTHGFFFPYRGISFRTPFAGYEGALRRYLAPIKFKAGDILFFDNRLVHYSHTNLSANERIVVMSGIFPREAEILSVYKDESKPGSPFEIFKQSEDFLITNKTFYKDCTARPYRGELVETLDGELPLKSESDFLNWAVTNNVQYSAIPELTQNMNNMHIISEPGPIRQENS